MREGKRKGEREEQIRKGGKGRGRWNGGRKAVREEEGGERKRGSGEDGKD